jgi:hypothetical protein
MAEFKWEDGLTERKTENDLKDLRKTLVAFANTVRPEHTARILIGECDDGTVQGVKNPDNIQRKVRAECEEVYPPIIWRQRVYEKDGKSCVEVEIEYSGETPHFGSPAWVRIGSESVVATEETFQKLISMRSSKARQLELWRGKEITISYPVSSDAFGFGPSVERQAASAFIVEVSSFWVTFRLAEVFSLPLEAVSMSWDHRNKRLWVMLDRNPSPF